MCEILPYVDFEKIRQEEPKWFMGYSDNTNLLFLLATLCDTAGIYGPCAAAFGMEPWHESLKNSMEILTGMCKKVHNYDKWEREGLKTEENPLVPYNVTELSIMYPDLLTTTKYLATASIHRTVKMYCHLVHLLSQKPKHQTATY